MVDYAWIVIFVVLVLRHYRIAQVLAAPAIVPDLARLLYGQFTGTMPTPTIGPWAFWVLIHVVPVLAMTAFRRDAPPVPRWPWLLALPANYLLVAVPLLALQGTGNPDWLPDFSGLYCILVALACLVHAPRARSRTAVGSGVWSLTLSLLAADAGAYRIFSIADYLHDPHLIAVSLAELLILVAAAALVAPTPPAPRPQCRHRHRIRTRYETAGLPRRTQDMPFPPRPSSVLASMLAAAGLMLTVGSCSHVTPIGPDRTATTMPPSRHLGHRSSCKSCAASLPRQRASARPVTLRSPRRAPPERATASSVRRSRSPPQRSPPSPHMASPPCTDS